MFLGDELKRALLSFSLFKASKSVFLVSIFLNPKAFLLMTLMRLLVVSDLVLEIVSFVVFHTQ
ncbi:hypothetical protein SSU98_0428 [Streptococcus suis 98HAH33]|nr:hypothetical protein SSU05_0441 [Streptococcus suis 05ZYH33]ABP91586.1 hypothetical protein SSU98_0428 [Streptococcus suis 98HAH33]